MIKVDLNNEGPVRLMELAISLAMVGNKSFEGVIDDAEIKAMMERTQEYSVPKIPQELFLGMGYKERIVALKKHFETLMIKCYQVVDNYIPVVDEKSRKLNEEVKKASSMIARAVNNDMGFGTALIRCFLHNDNNPSMTWANEKHGWHCFACMQREDVEKGNIIFDLYNYLQWRHGFKGYNKFKNAYEMAVHLFVEDGENIENPYEESTKQKEHSHFIAYTPRMNRVRHYSFHHPLSTEGLEICAEKLEERGISMATANKHSVMLWMHNTKEGKFLGAVYWIFLNDDGSYTRRLAAVDKSTRARLNMHPDADKWKNPAKQSQGVFNQRILNHCRQWDEVCFVTESAIDALSVEELGFHAVGTNSVKNVHRFLKENVDTDADIKLICLLDNDEPGRKIAKLFVNRNLFVPDYLELDYDGDRWLSKHKDINEALVADRDKTLDELQALEQEALEYYTHLEDKIDE
ncbi:toprim domain-containing protein [Fusibacter ferrireducens]|uniref:Toprim domain-containing protein n=1 Tax=Fusibacter ferrireducens TaxID=2785058 RepID=A0ABR9ZX94_9FIRM|nr:toprim domain-containing protein [Fusibacter ferrireducens]MBF4695080.1 toprim domain-containing protein [Fusibacter ferrireducens]